MDANCCVWIHFGRRSALFHQTQSHLHTRTMQPPAPAERHQSTKLTIISDFISESTERRNDICIWCFCSGWCRATPRSITTCWVLMWDQRRFESYPMCRLHRKWSLFVLARINANRLQDRGWWSRRQGCCANITQKSDACALFAQIQRWYDSAVFKI